MSFALSNGLGPLPVAGSGGGGSTVTFDQVLLSGDFPQTSTLTPLRLTEGDTAGSLGMAITDDNGGVVLLTGEETVTFNLRATGETESVIDDAEAAFFAQERTGVRLVKFTFSEETPVPAAGTYEATFVIAGVTYPLGRRQPVRVQEAI